MSNQRTLGPWRVSGDHPSVYGGETGHTLIAMCYTGPKKNAWMNAHIIAAAPELLDALKNIVDNEGFIELGRLKAAWAAINKAEGRDE